MPDRAAATPDGFLFRIAYGPDPWQPIAYDPECPPHNRFDDPEKRYHVLYASSSIFGCYVETTARFRRRRRTGARDAPSIGSMIAELARIKGKDDVPVQPGVVPREWFYPRVLGVASSSAQYADICHSSWQQHLRARLKGIPTQMLDDEQLTLAVLFRSWPRIVTQRISRLIWGESRYAGIRYPSKWGTDIVCWALYEPFQLTAQSRRGISRHDDGFRSALDLHGLRLSD